MASTYSQYRLALIQTGTESGQWGDITNANLGSASAGVYQGIEQAIGGKATVTFSSTTATLTWTDSSSSQDARALYLDLDGTPGGAAELVLPATQKAYIVKNGTGETVTVKTAAGSGVAVPNGKTMWVYNDGTDVVTAIDNLPSGTTIGGSSIGTGSVTSVGGTGTVNGITLTGTVTSSGNLTLGGTLSNVNLTSQVTSTLPVANGGTGRTSLTSNNVILGAGTSQVGFVAPGTSGNVLTSNGTTWVSSAPAGGGGGAIVQSLTFVKTSSQTFTTTSEVSVTGWSATPSITISSASNRARATLCIPIYIVETVLGGGTFAIIKIKSGGTEYARAYPIMETQGGTISFTQTFVAELPAGAGTKTFDITWQNAGADVVSDLNQGGEPTYLILEEIAP